MLLLVVSRVAFFFFDQFSHCDLICLLFDFFQKHFLLVLSYFWAFSGNSPTLKCCSKCLLWQVSSIAND